MWEPGRAGGGQKDPGSGSGAWAGGTLGRKAWMWAVRRISPDSGLSRESVKATERLKYNWTLPGEC